MSLQMDDKKKFLVVLSNEEQRLALAELISKQVSTAQILFAQDGIEAQFKFANDPPHVLILEGLLSKKSGFDVAEWALGKTDHREVAIILIAPIPEGEKFVDEVVTGRVQYLDNSKDESKLSQRLARALNYVSSDSNQKFHLKFLAAGELLIKAGEPGEFVYIVRRGTLNAITYQKNNQIILGTIYPGEFVGEMAYINGEPRSANVVANSECELIEIPSDQMDHLLFQKPSWSKALMRTLSRRLKQANEE